MKPANPQPASPLRATAAPRTRRSRTTVAEPFNAASASPDAIARRAYQLFESRNRQHGHDLEDWLKAEAELTAVAPRKRRTARPSA